MAYGLYCTIPFTSLNGTSCQIQIWRDGYSGAVSTISPDNPSTRGYAAEDPFYFEEESDHDLLKFIRVKTGYIRLIEKDNDSLSFLYPTREMQHYVRVYYGAYNSQQPLQNLVFTGYMRCQEFSNDWVAPPAVREFPVISPLGMIGTQLFDTYTPQLLTMGSVLASIMTKLSMDYSKVIWPGGQELWQGDYYGALYPWNGKIHSTAICPFSSPFDQLATVPELYSPQTIEWFLNGLCACKGWMLHDEPDALVFTKFDNNNKYYDYLDKDDLTNIPGHSEYVFLDRPDSHISLDNYFELDGDDGQVSTMQPIKKLTVGVEKVGVYSKETTPEYVTNWQRNVGLEDDKYVLSLSGENVGPQTESDVWTDPSSQGVVVPGGHVIINTDEDGHTTVGSITPTWVILPDPNWDGQQTIIRFRFFGPITSTAVGYLLLKSDIMIGPNDANLKKPSEWIESGDISSFHVGTEIDIDGRQIIPERLTPEDERQLIRMGFSDVDGSILIPFPGLHDTGAHVINALNIRIHQILGMPNNWRMNINMRVIDPYDYTYMRGKPKDKFIINPSYNGLDEKEITCGITDFTNSENSFGDKDGQIAGDVPTYNMFKFMFAPQIFLEVPLSRKNVALPMSIYLPRWNYWKDNTYDWRVISVNFHLRDDEYRLTLAHTDNMNDNPA